MKVFEVHVYVWGSNGDRRAPLILTYLRDLNRESPGYWKTISVQAEDGRRAKQKAEKIAREELKASGIYQRLIGSEDGIKRLAESSR